MLHSCQIWRELGGVGFYAQPFPQTTKPLKLFVSDNKAKILTLDTSKNVINWLWHLLLSIDDPHSSLTPWYSWAVSQCWPGKGILCVWLSADHRSTCQCVFLGPLTQMYLNLDTFPPSAGLWLLPGSQDSPWTPSTAHKCTLASIQDTIPSEQKYLTSDLRAELTSWSQAPLCVLFKASRVLFYHLLTTTVMPWEQMLGLVKVGCPCGIRKPGTP